MARNYEATEEISAESIPTIDIRAKARKIVVVTYELEEGVYELLLSTLYGAGPVGTKFAETFRQATHEAYSRLENS